MKIKSVLLAASLCAFSIVQAQTAARPAMPGMPDAEQMKANQAYHQAVQNLRGSDPKIAAAIEKVETLNREFAEAAQDYQAKLAAAQDAVADLVLPAMAKMEPSIATLAAKEKARLDAEKALRAKAAAEREAAKAASEKYLSEMVARQAKDKEANDRISAEIEKNKAANEQAMKDLKVISPMPTPPPQPQREATK